MNNLNIQIIGYSKNGWVFTNIGERLSCTTTVILKLENYKKVVCTVKTRNIAIRKKIFIFLKKFWNKKSRILISSMFLYYIHMHSFIRICKCNFFEIKINPKIPFCSYLFTINLLHRFCLKINNRIHKKTFKTTFCYTIHIISVYTYIVLFVLII